MGHIPRSIKLYHQEPCVESRLSHHLSQYFHRLAPLQDLVAVCIGTDRSTGDALGPFVGTELLKRDMPCLHVYGTLDDPVHAMNLNETIAAIDRRHKSPFIIAIDACLGQAANVGTIQIGDGPVKPGAGVNKDLPEIGNIHITGIVNVGGFMEYFVLQNTRLSLVIRLARIISESIIDALPVQSLSFPQALTRS